LRLNSQETINVADAIKLPINAQLAIARRVVIAFLKPNAKRHVVPTQNTIAIGPQHPHNVLKIQTVNLALRTA